MEKSTADSLLTQRQSASKIQSKNSSASVISSTSPAITAVHKEFESFLLSKSTEPAWFHSFRRQQLEAMLERPEVPTRYGLNISIPPLSPLFAGVVPAAFKVTGPRAIAFDPKDGIAVYPWSFQKPDTMPAAVAERVQRILHRLLKTNSIEPESKESKEKPKSIDSELEYSLTAALQGFATDIVVIDIPAGSTSTVPVSLQWNIKQHQFSLILILAGKKSKSSLLLQSSVAENCPVGTHAGRFVVVDAEEESSVGVTVADHTTSAVVALNQQVSFIQKNAKVNWTGLSRRENYTRDHFGSQLIGEGAATSIAVAVTGTANARCDLSTSAFHRSPKTRSTILTKTLVDGTAKSVARGLIGIDPAAFGSEGFEQQDAIILSSTAEADAIPNLEIANHDVKCSHGSTVGELDDEALFYLCSRGLPPKDAERLLLAGFVGSVIEQIEHPVIREEMAKSVGAFLP